MRGAADLARGSINLNLDRSRSREKMRDSSLSQKEESRRRFEAEMETSRFRKSETISLFLLLTREKKAQVHFAGRIKKLITRVRGRHRTTKASSSQVAPVTRAAAQTNPRVKLPP